MHKLLILAFAIMIIASCQSNSSKTKEENMSRKDVHSFARPLEAVVRNLDLDLQVDFDAKQLRGTATLQIENLQKVNHLHLDSRDLKIDSITLDD